ncbi:hypothetical protein TURU_017082 [Turdus rufiventris]|nr:hypothetical protein TURU_017082 [Turdus rufiventris]
MTPFWRGVSLRPIGASCRDNSECLTMLCRESFGKPGLGSPSSVTAVTCTPPVVLGAAKDRTEPSCFGRGMEA